VNDVLIKNDMYIDKDWDWKVISSSYMKEGQNSVKIVLKGNTTLWIDYVVI